MLVCLAIIGKNYQNSAQISGKMKLGEKISKNFNISKIYEVLPYITVLKRPKKSALVVCQDIYFITPLLSRKIQYHKENVQPQTRRSPFDDAVVSFNHPAKF